MIGLSHVALLGPSARNEADKLKHEELEIAVNEDQLELELKEI
jgi:hypothetical protein